MVLAGRMVVVKKEKKGGIRLVGELVDIGVLGRVGEEMGQVWGVVTVLMDVPCGAREMFYEGRWVVRPPAGCAVVEHNFMMEGGELRRAVEAEEAGGKLAEEAEEAGSKRAEEAGGKRAEAKLGEAGSKRAEAGEEAGSKRAKVAE